FVACWTPYIFITLIEIYTNRYVRVPPWLDGVLQTICFAQSGLNPFVYIIFNRRSKSLPTVIITSIKTDSPTIRSQGLQYESTSSYGTARTPLRLNSYRS
ncbi:unnamed protein product, partial [Rotaria magnacalcarata]